MFLVSFCSKSNVEKLIQRHRIFPGGHLTQRNLTSGICDTTVDQMIFIHFSILRCRCIFSYLVTIDFSMLDRRPNGFGLSNTDRCCSITMIGRGLCIRLDIVALVGNQTRAAGGKQPLSYGWIDTININTNIS